MKIGEYIGSKHLQGVLNERLVSQSSIGAVNAEISLAQNLLYAAGMERTLEILGLEDNSCSG